MMIIIVVVVVVDVVIVTIDNIPFSLSISVSFKND